MTCLLCSLHSGLATAAVCGYPAAACFLGCCYFYRKQPSFCLGLFVLSGRLLRSNSISRNISSRCTGTTIGHKNRLVKVPRGHMWVEGDHHGHSFDSNSFGPVSLGLLHAHATHILWPPERWQRLESVLPPERCPLQTGEK
ncbi:mitochondrial inner membrane protease subunit 2 isoform X2 [Mus musculus]|uniref:mitochondrial inner membrane protease subunit 2 isoform X2 n=1 Tax=Mus musculus TaxID=10090 RepID=UPI0007ED395A|nr:mitochondrial inner membrane protease subunit 2 isoform X2 [Mus musculus]|eukprot:XP_017170751.1 PREDICTED: mitochondrial inner membrane protease subunit 2 isoform X2 [Mus musculus]